MKKLAEVHGIPWGDRELPVMHDNTQSFWEEAVSACLALTEANSIARISLCNLDKLFSYACTVCTSASKCG